ncbi:MAG: TonB-dependent receptor, partial [Acidobacteriota bacterium]|nr:TonB-dependent receptor [Acidobacteriota bacterium]
MPPPGVRIGPVRRSQSCGKTQFGFTVGGPIVHNKTFFFGDYQGTRIAQTSLHNPTVPTAAERASGFTNLQDLIFNQSGTRTDALGRIFPNGAVLDPATTRPITAGQIDPVTGLTAQGSGYVRDPFFQGNIAGVTNFATAANEHLMNILPTNRLNPNALKLLNAYPAPNTAGFSGGLSNNYAILRPQPNNTNQFDIRADQNFSEKDQMFARVGYAARNQNAAPDFTGDIDNSQFGQGNFKDRAVNAALSETHLFSPTMINEVRLGYSLLTDNIVTSVANQTGIPEQFGIQGAPQGPGLGGLPNINIPGLTSIGPGNFAAPNTRTSDTRQITENLTKIRGPHTFKGGFEGQWLRYSYDNPRAALGSFNFDSTYTGIPGGAGAGAGMATLLLTPIPATVATGVNYDGGPGFLIADSNVAPDNVRHYYGLYFQDDWKVTPKLALNAGLRWEHFSLPMNRYGAEANFESFPSFVCASYVINTRSKDVALSPAFT